MNKHVERRAIAAEGAKSARRYQLNSNGSISVSKRGYGWEFDRTLTGAEAEEIINRYGLTAENNFIQTD